MKYEELGEEQYLDEDSKLLSQIRKKPAKKGIDVLNSADLTDRDLDELFAEM